MRGAAILCGLWLAAPLFADEAADRHFLRQTRPLLVSRCVGCHGEDAQEGNLRLDSREAVLRGGDRGPAIALDHPNASLLLKSVRHDDAKFAMPPKEKLSADEIEAFARWIRDGAPWPEFVPPPAGRRGDAWSDPENPIVRIFGGKRLDLWSLKPIRDPHPPANGAVSALDAFLPVSAKLLDRRALARKLSYDLTGLPPTFAEVQSFADDETPDAVERFADRLFASPRYGENQARMWLDVVRYSDSNGFDWDEFRPHAWRFRDYVIASFNADKPYDVFLREQLAGDESLAGPPQTDAERDALVATGFLRLGPHDNAAPLFNEQARSRSELLTDLVETTGSAFLGLTFSCCRCHDHKFDPLSHADHFRLRAFFEGVRFGDDLAVDLADVQQAKNEHNAAIDQQIAKVEERKKGADKSQHKSLDEELAALKKQLRPLTRGLLMTDQKDGIAATHVLYQGDYRQPRDKVEAGFLSALDPNPAAIGTVLNANTSGRRSALAAWLVSAENPLTARVMANRLWQGMFGEGLVATPNDFGSAGSRPTHPELLDHLATEFVRGGWSVKTLQRRLVTSDVYRRPKLRRLSAEQLRDSLLSVSGLLTAKAEGKPIWPELPAEVLQANPAFLDDNAEKTKGWYPSPPAERNARSIFLVQKRTVRIPFLETFDLPDNQVSCARRVTSTVAPQALSLLNSALAVDAAEALADRIAAGAETPEGQVDELFRNALQRKPRDDERSACLAFLRSRGLVELGRVLLNLNEFAYLD